MGKRAKPMVVSVLTQAQWDEEILIRHRESEEIFDYLYLRDDDARDAILAPRRVRPNDTVHMMGVRLDLDWKLSTRLQMVELARSFITESLFIGTLDPSLTTVLGTIIEGKGLYEHSIGEFFELYGKFEQEHKTKGPGTKAKMMALVDGDSRYFKSCWEHEKEVEDPLPYAVRNILAHKGTNKNTLESDEIRTSIKLLKSWVDS